MDDNEGQYPVTTLHGYTNEELLFAYAKHETQQERARLERAVVEAAKAWVKPDVSHLNRPVVDRRLANATYELLQFEQEHECSKQSPSSQAS